MFNLSVAFAYSKIAGERYIENAGERDGERERRERREGRDRENANLSNLGCAWVELDHKESKM